MQPTTSTTSTNQNKEPISVAPYKESGRWAIAEKSLILTPFVAIKNIAIGLFKTIANSFKKTDEKETKRLEGIEQLKHGLKTFLPVIGWTVVIYPVAKEYLDKRAEEKKKADAEKKENQAI